jgi:Bacterial Ig-like domain (group 4).
MKRISPFLLLLMLVLVAAPLPARSRKKTPRTIRETAPVLVETPVGTAPLLPYQVWVTYADNTGEWRQVKWTNSLRETEEEEAALPVGTDYTVQGYILGDNTTDNGYPLEARVKVTAGKAPAPAPVASPLPLGSVRLIGDTASRPTATWTFKTF